LPVYKVTTRYLQKQVLAGRKHKNPIHARTLTWLAKKNEITAWLEAHREEIESGRLKVFFQDECHLLWGDVCPKGYRFAYGYVWGQTKERIGVPMTNERCKQTYYGAIDLQSHELLVQPHTKGESSSTIAFLKHLQSQYPQSRIATRS
jgi:hypothetical protein